MTTPEVLPTAVGAAGPAERLDWAELLDGLVRGEDLDEANARAALDAIMRGDVPPAQVAGFLVALRAKGEQASELVGLVATMRAHAVPVRAPDGAVDTAGTGGDRSGTFNVSTLAAVVAAGAGAVVAKHGNRAASGRCGSADVLEAWGLVTDLPPEGVERCLAEAGIGFCYAPSYHPATRHVMPARRELGIRTVFNVLGPLTNPAGVRHQTVGVSDVRMAPRMAEVLARLDARHALVFTGPGGMDELSTTGPSNVWEVRDGTVTEWELEPESLGLRRASLAELQGGDVPLCRGIADEVFNGAPGAPRDIVALGAAAALYAADRAASLGEGLEAAFAAIDEGRAAATLDRWVTVAREAAAT
ncbi:anthranilate phosphoribosyltransferase [Egibacter rhizosphaerae]|uniref:Anthranilate phosphoribosyltransferase n=1 Tax=Egibacter rhizosphaerae TaxID=1670831 RepID=A0A411YAJ3_9ACTN|nr:anthranilate phosphoribosyltransferase [Egibacter rhizosphaerae]QBI18221.1 anthranilate phosphoribosyltransferase [Egibacter rhizosphaerae]